MLRGRTRSELSDALIGPRADEKTAVLAQLGMMALQEPEPAVVTIEVTRVVVDILDLELSVVLEMAPSGDCFLRRSWLGFRSPPASVVSSSEVALAAHAIERRASVVFEDLAREKRFRCPLLAREEIVSGACTVVHGPGNLRDTPYGCLLAGTRSNRVLDAGEVAFLEAVSAILGSVIHRARLTAEIEQQRDTLQAVIEQFPAGVVFHDAADKHIQLISRRLAAMCGIEWTPTLAFEDIVARYPAWFPDGRSLEVNDYAGVRALRGESIRQEILLDRGDGTTCSVIDTAAPVYDRRGCAVGSVAAIHDISAEKALVDERERLLEQANHAVAARDDILAVVSHDLRTPAGVVALAASILEQQADGLGSEEVRTLAGRIHRAASGMQQIIGDLLDYARIEMGRLVISTSDECVEEVVAQAIEGFSTLAAQRAVELRPKLEGLEGVRLRCDRRRIAQVLSNLIANALKFVSPGGGIDVGGRTSDREVVIFVHDEGPGIKPGHLEHVFDRYWQSDGDVARDGLGLGLSIVKGIVEAHGGRVWAESPPGDGATFAFALPL